MGLNPIDAPAQLGPTLLAVAIASGLDRLDKAGPAPSIEMKRHAR
jgi:hypothetical protein